MVCETFCYGPERARVKFEQEVEQSIDALRLSGAKAITDLRGEMYGRLAEGPQLLQGLNDLWQHYDQKMREWDTERGLK